MNNSQPPMYEVFSEILRKMERPLEEVQDATDNALTIDQNVLDALTIIEDVEQSDERRKVSAQFLYVRLQSPMPRNLKQQINSRLARAAADRNGDARVVGVIIKVIDEVSKSLQ